MKNLLLLALVVTLSFSLKAQKNISADQASKHYGEKVTITGKIIGKKFIRNERKQHTIFNMGNVATPDLNIVINNNIKKNFPYNPDEYLTQKLISVTGTITEQDGKPAIIINGPQDIKVQDGNYGMDFKPLEFDGFNRFFQDEE